MSATGAIAFVAQHGIVLEASRHGAIPSLADAVAGETWLTTETMAAAKCLSAAAGSSAFCMLTDIELGDSENRP